MKIWILDTNLWLAQIYLLKLSFISLILPFKRTINWYLSLKEKLIINILPCIVMPWLVVKRYDNELKLLIICWMCRVLKTFLNKNTIEISVLSVISQNIILIRLLFQITDLMVLHYERIFCFYTKNYTKWYWITIWYGVHL